MARHSHTGLTEEERHDTWMMV